MPYNPTNPRLRNPGVTRSIPRWCGFWLSGPLLFASVLIEGMYSTIAAVHFFFTRKRQRERFKAMLLGQGRIAAALVLATSVLLVSVGCTSFPGASFGDQIDQLSWSAEALASDNGKPADVFLDFHSMFIGDLNSDALAETFEQLGW